MDRLSWILQPGVIDWAAAALSIAGILLNAHKHIWCWPIWIASNAAWVGYASLTGQWAVLATFTAFFLGNLYGWYRWEMDRLAKHLSGAIDVSALHTTHLSEKDWEAFMEMLNEDPELTEEMQSAMEAHNKLIAQ